MLKVVDYPKHLFHGIRPLLRDYPLPENLVVFGSDTETVHGHAMSLQISGPEDDLFMWVDEATVLDEFLSWCLPRCRTKGVNLCYFHNLNFDARVLLNQHQRKIYEQGSSSSFTVDYKGVEVEFSVLFGKVNKITVRHGSVALHIYDSKAFTQASLARSLKMFAIPQDKLAHPEGLGSVDFRLLPSSDPRLAPFKEYSIQDARAQRALSLKILEFHDAYKVPPSISLPSFAAKVFRRHFIRAGETIPFPSLDIVRAGELSYHGGLNFPRRGDPLDQLPGVFEDLYEVDISSAYPFAMTELPELTCGSYERVDDFTYGPVGIYCISGYIKADDYPVVFDHSFKPVHGPFKELWHTSYEVAFMLSSCPEVVIEKCWGYVWRPERGGSNPFRRYIQHFYERKESVPKTDPYYHLYKITMNALYGKLASTVEVVSSEGQDEVAKLREAGVELPKDFAVDEKIDPVLGKVVNITKGWRAGSMYNPVIGSLITGHTRAYIGRLMREHKAVHAATDSIKTHALVPPVKGLGGLKVECHGRAYIFRNKLYLHCSKGFDYCGHKPNDLPFKYPKKTIDGDPHPRAGEPLVDDDGQHLCKVGMHGYQGPLWVLWDNRRKLMLERSLDYEHIHVVGLREGLLTKQKPCDFIKVPKVLKLDDDAEAEQASDSPFGGSEILGGHDD